MTLLCGHERVAAGDEREPAGVILSEAKDLGHGHL